MPWEPTTQEIDEKLVELAYIWGDIEEAFLAVSTQAADDIYFGRPTGNQEYDANVGHALSHAFRVEAYFEHNGWGDPCVWYRLVFDVTDRAKRRAARWLQDNSDGLRAEITSRASMWHTRDFLEIASVPRSAPLMGHLCRRAGEEHPAGTEPTLADVPDQVYDSAVPLERRDHYLLTPIEAPFYDALRDTGLTFAVQPWIQGVDRRYRVDFLVFSDGNCVAVELDGHEFHKSREDRSRDAERDRWLAGRKIQTIRWTGSQVYADPQGCVSELLNVLRAAAARP